jgi:hypothetical protein
MSECADGRIAFSHVIQASRSHRRRLQVVAVVVVGPPGYSSGEIGDTGTTTVEVTFSENINATDYKAGVTIKANSVSQTISTATRQGDQTVVHYVLSAALDVNDGITWEYDDDFGDYEDDDGNPMADVSAQAVSNYIGSHLYFDTADDAVWIGAV